MLANLHARHAGRDRLELTAILGRRQWLEIPGVLVGGPAPHEQDDASLGASPAGGILCRRFLRLQQLRQTKANQAERACAQKLPPTHWGGLEESVASRREHGLRFLEGNSFRQDGHFQTSKGNRERKPVL